MQRTFLSLGRIAAWLAGLLVVAALALWWWAGTEGSLDWTLRQIARYQPLTAQGVTGSLRSGARVQRLHWQGDGLEVEVSDLKLEWQPLALLRGQLLLDQAEAARVRIKDTRPPQPSSGPPQSLDLPLPVAIAEARIGQLEWLAADNTVTLANVEANYRFDGGTHHATIDRLQWSGGSYRAKASIGANDPLPVDATVEGRFETEVPGSEKRLPLTFSAALHGPVADMQAKAVLQALASAPAAPTRATATARITPWAAQPVPQAQAEFRQLDLRAFWREAPNTSLAGQLSLQPAGTNTWAVSTELRNEIPGPWDKERLPVERLDARGEWRLSGQAVVRDLQAQVGGGSVKASGQWRGADGWITQGTLSGVNPAALHSAMAAVPVSGRADVSGEGEAISFDVELQAARRDAAAARPQARANELAAAVKTLELRSVVGRGRWNDGLLSLPTLQVRTADASLQASLDVRPQSWTGSGRATLQAPGLRAVAQGKVAEASGGGTARVDSDSIGPALAWLQRMPYVPAAVRDLSAAGRGEVQFAWQGGWRDPAVQATMALPLLELRDSQGAAAWTVRDAAASVRGRLSDARVVARARAEIGERRLGVELAGTGGRQSGAPAVWQGQVGTLNVSASDPALGTGTWTLRVQQPVGIRWSSARLEVGAGEAIVAAPVRPSDRTRAALGPTVLAWEPVRWRSGELNTAGRISGLPLAWIEIIGGPQLAGSALSGDMVLGGEWDATLDGAPRVRASLARTGGDVGVMVESVDGASARVRAGVREARLTLVVQGADVTATLNWDSERAGSAEGRLVTRLARGGAAGWHWPEAAPLSGGLEARLPRIGVWSLLAPPGWRLRGALVADIDINGTRADPQLSGAIVVEDLALRSVVDGVQLQGGQLRARLEGNRLVIEEFVLHGAGEGTAGGTLRATGEGRWTAQGLQVRMAAQLERLRASIRTDRQLTVSGQLAARLDASGTTITGDLNVDRARIQLPDERTPRLGEDVVVRGARGPIGGAPVSADKPASRPFEVAVNIDLGQDFRVQGMGINTLLRGSVAVTGDSIAQPRLVGTIRAVGGEYRAYGQRLNIERGVIRFTGPPENPALDILALRPNMLERVGVLVTGRAQAPFVRLYSEPEMPDVEKLSMLVTGQRAPSGGAEAALVQQAALALLASRGGGSGRGIAATLGLDELSFRRDGAEGPAIAFGKRFGRNFYASYERSLSGALGTLFIFYDLTRRLTLRAEAGQDTAVDLIITLTFN